ncbi:hypothetical protein H2248_000701 [Termitomyces sp. 'cryptogamus']|nr:hypothetical protein H2248_000701 [Termitomyces sp. 'cryptogamus']
MMGLTEAAKAATEYTKTHPQIKSVHIFTDNTAAVSSIYCHDPSPEPRTSSINPPNPQKTPDAPPNFRPCPAPISANSDASPANSDGPLANFGAFPAATDTYPGSPEPREPPPLFPIFATHHQLNTLAPLTYSGVSRQPRGDPRSPMIPSTYQRGPILDRNRHLPTPLSSAKPRRRSRRTPKFSGSQLRSQTPTLFHQVQTSLFAQSRTPSTPIDLPSNPGSAPIDHTAVHSFASANLPYSLLPEPRQDHPISSQPDFSGPSRICLNHIPPTTRTRHQCPDVFECSVTSARGSRLPSKDSPSAAEPPRSVEPDIYGPKSAAGQ